jgi:hypothetical protein
MQEDCYNCLKTRQWFFLGLSVFFGYEFRKTYPYKTWKTFGFNLAPVVVFGFGSAYCYFRAEKVYVEKIEKIKREVNQRFN